MTLLDANTLAQIKGDQALAWPDTAIISRLSQVTNGIGEVIDTWSAVGTAECRLMASDLKDAVSIAEGFPQVDAAGVWRVTFDDTEDVRGSDRLQINSIRYDVIQIDDEGAWRTALRTIVHRREAQ